MSQPVPNVFVPVDFTPYQPARPDTLVTSCPRLPARLPVVAVTTGIYPLKYQGVDANDLLYAPQFDATKIAGPGSLFQDPSVTLRSIPRMLMDARGPAKDCCISCD